MERQHRSRRSNFGRSILVGVVASLCAAPLSPHTNPKMSPIEPHRFHEYVLLQPIATDGPAVGAFDGAELVLVSPGYRFGLRGTTRGAFSAALVASAASDDGAVATDCSVVPWLSIAEVSESDREAGSSSNLTAGGLP